MPKIQGGMKHFIPMCGPNALGIKGSLKEALELVEEMRGRINAPVRIIRQTLIGSPNPFFIEERRVWPTVGKKYWPSLY